VRLPSEVEMFERERAAVQCWRCRVALPAGKLHMADRCMNPDCPVAAAHSSREPAAEPASPARSLPAQGSAGEELA
jgi:hypothetical protein